MKSDGSSLPPPVPSGEVHSRPCLPRPIPSSLSPVSLGSYLTSFPVPTPGLALQLAWPWALPRNLLLFQSPSLTSSSRLPIPSCSDSNPSHIHSLPSPPDRHPPTNSRHILLRFEFLRLEQLDTATCVLDRPPRLLSRACWPTHDPPHYGSRRKGRITCIFSKSYRTNPRLELPPLPIHNRNRRTLINPPQIPRTLG